MSLSKLNEKLARQEVRAKEYEKQRANSVQGKIYRLKMKITKNQIKLHPIELSLGEQRRKKAKLNKDDKAAETRLKSEITKYNKEINALREKSKITKKSKVAPQPKKEYVLSKAAKSMPESKQEYLQAPALTADFEPIEKRKRRSKSVSSYVRSAHTVKAHKRAGGTVSGYKLKGYKRGTVKSYVRRAHSVKAHKRSGGVVAAYTRS